MVMLSSVDGHPGPSGQPCMAGGTDCGGNIGSVIDNTTVKLQSRTLATTYNSNHFLITRE